MRILGVALLLAAALLVCRMIGEYERRRILETEEMLRLLCAIKAGISAGNLPLCEIYAMHSSQALTECGALPALRQGKSYEQALCSSLIPGPVKAHLAAFGSALGRHRREQETELCDYYIRELEGTLEVAKRESAVRLKSRRTVTVTAALMLAVLFL